MSQWALCLDHVWLSLNWGSCWRVGPQKRLVCKLGLLRIVLRWSSFIFKKHLWILFLWQNSQGTLIGQHCMKLWKFLGWNSASGDLSCSKHSAAENQWREATNVCLDSQHCWMRRGTQTCMVFHHTLLKYFVLPRLLHNLSSYNFNR